MKSISFITVLFLLCLTAGASGSDRKTSTVADQLAREIEAKIANRVTALVKASANDCQLHIEFSAHHVSFDLPLQGTEVAADSMEDSIIVINRRMTRTFSDRGAEAFEKLLLRFNRHEINDIKSTFDQAIKACGA